MTGDRILAADLSVLAIPALVGQEKSRSATLEFNADGDGRTHIGKQFTPYPFHVCRPFYVADDPAGMATVYIQSCAGGIFEHDRLALTLRTEQGSRAHVTTSASTIVHSTPVGEAHQLVNLAAAPKSMLEYLPDPLILFAGSRISSSVNVVIDETACIVLSDAFLMHDYRNQGDAFDWFRTEVVVRNTNNEILVRDRIRVDGKAMLAGIPGVNGRFTAQASFLCLTREIGNDALASMRARLDAIEDIYAGVSLLPNGAGVFARILAADGVALRAAQLALWAEARRYLTGVAPIPRRK